MCERESQIEMLQRQLQDATKEMEETTETLKRIALERDTFEKKIGQLSNLNTDLKKQLQTLNDRCQQLQEELTFLERSYQIKSKDVRKHLRLYTNCHFLLLVKRINC